MLKSERYNLTLTQELKKSSKKIDKAEKLIAQERKRLAYESKYYMDAIKVTAKNIFCSLITKFRPYCDLSQLFRDVASHYIPVNAVIFLLPISIKKD